MKLNSVTAKSIATPSARSADSFNSFPKAAKKPADDDDDDFDDDDLIIEEDDDLNLDEILDINIEDGVIVDIAKNIFQTNEAKPRCRFGYKI
jgi:hypothetical protein